MLSNFHLPNTHSNWTGLSLCDLKYQLNRFSDFLTLSYKIFFTVSLCPSIYAQFPLLWLHTAPTQYLHSFCIDSFILETTAYQVTLLFTYQNLFRKATNCGSVLTNLYKPLDLHGSFALF